MNIVAKVVVLESRKWTTDGTQTWQMMLLLDGDTSVNITTDDPVEAKNFEEVDFEGFVTLRALPNKGGLKLSRARFSATDPRLSKPAKAAG
ncbi:MAG: hypothetical protein AAGI53_17935 [Planctomycetota bacterium]